eukprot:366432-Chlamydomonas_euryale.AAC.14
MASHGVLNIWMSDVRMSMPTLLCKLVVYSLQGGLGRLRAVALLPVAVWYFPSHGAGCQLTCLAQRFESSSTPLNMERHAVGSCRPAAPSFITYTWCTLVSPALQAINVCQLRRSCVLVVISAMPLDSPSCTLPVASTRSTPRFRLRVPGSVPHQEHFETCLRVSTHARAHRSAHAHASLHTLHMLKIDPPRLLLVASPLPARRAGGGAADASDTDAPPPPIDGPSDRAALRSEAAPRHCRPSATALPRTASGPLASRAPRQRRPARERFGGGMDLAFESRTHMGG